MAENDAQSLDIETTGGIDGEPVEIVETRKSYNVKVGEEGLTRLERELRADLEEMLALANLESSRQMAKIRKRLKLSLNGIKIHQGFRRQD